MRIFHIILFGLVLLAACKPEKPNPQSNFIVSGNAVVFDTLTFINQSTGADKIFWILNGDTIYDDQSIRYYNSHLGAVQMQLYAINGEMVSYSTKTIMILSGADSMAGEFKWHRISNVYTSPPQGGPGTMVYTNDTVLFSILYINDTTFQFEHGGTRFIFNHCCHLDDLGFRMEGGGKTTHLTYNKFTRHVHFWMMWGSSYSSYETIP